MGDRPRANPRLAEIRGQGRVQAEGLRARDARAAEAVQHAPSSASLHVVVTGVREHIDHPAQPQPAVVLVTAHREAVETALAPRLRHVVLPVRAAAYFQSRYARSAARTWRRTRAPSPTARRIPR
jgi:hypothetical protein